MFVFLELRSYYTIEGHPCEKIFRKFFLEMTPLWVKTFEFDIFEAKKHFTDSKKACILNQKVEKIIFLQGLGLGLSSF